MTDTLDQTERNAASGTGHSPTGGFAPLVPELDVTDIARSLWFWTDILGFRVAYDRPAAKSAYLERQGAQIMLCQVTGEWLTGRLEPPFGRGVNFQIETDELESILEALHVADWPLFRGVSESWYRIGATQESGNREFLVQDPDGYLVRFSQAIGSRPVGQETP